MDIGEHEASVTFDSLRLEFEIAPESPDGALLEQVRSGLKYVKDIRPGDTIPQELLDGSASWSIDDSHNIRAKNKIMLRIAAIGAPAGGLTKIPENLIKFLDETKTQLWIEVGLNTIAKSIGLGEGRAQSVPPLINKIARELAYIEALRDRYQSVTAILDKLERIAEFHVTERHFVDEVRRCQVLMGPPIKDFRRAFEGIDQRSRQVDKLLATVDEQVDFARKMRDELHQKMLIWDELIEKWDFESSGPSKTNREAVQFTYRFVAHNFPQNEDWM